MMTTAVHTQIAFPVFETRRLSAYRIDYIPFIGFVRGSCWHYQRQNPQLGDPVGSPHALFVAIDHGTSAYAPLIHAAIRLTDMEIEWIETRETCRRQGLAKELLAGIERYFGRNIYLEWISSPDGVGLVEWLKRHHAEQRP
jgi:GNAT superfamily N-acetyltransferase